MRKRGILAAIVATTVAIGSIAHAEYPEREIQGIVMWGQGGATDTVSRGVNDAAAAILGQNVNISNKPGGGGAISTAYVHTSRPDGYTILYGAENPQLHGVLGVSQLDYSDFYPINILGRGVAVIVVPANSEYQTIGQLLDDISANPESVRMGSTGPGGLPSTIAAIISNATDFEVTPVTFPGEGPGLEAMLRGNVDFMPTGIASSAQGIADGSLRALAVLNPVTVETLPDVPPITDTIPAIDRFLPWGPFYGVFVRRDVPAEAIATLTAAYTEAATDPAFLELMKNRGNVVMNISGSEAEEFLVRWQEVTAWVLQDTGAAKVNPSDLSIARP